MLRRRNNDFDKFKEKELFFLNLLKDLSPEKLLEYFKRIPNNHSDLIIKVKDEMIQSSTLAQFSRLRDIGYTPLDYVTFVLLRVTKLMSTHDQITAQDNIVKCAFDGLINDIKMIPASNSSDNYDEVIVKLITSMIDRQRELLDNIASNLKYSVMYNEMFDLFYSLINVPTLSLNGVISLLKVAHSYPMFKQFDNLVQVIEFQLNKCDLTSTNAIQLLDINQSLVRLGSSRLLKLFKEKNLINEFHEQDCVYFIVNFLQRLKDIPSNSLSAETQQLIINASEEIRSQQNMRFPGYDYDLIKIIKVPNREGIEVEQLYYDTSNLKTHLAFSLKQLQQLADKLEPLRHEYYLSAFGFFINPKSPIEENVLAVIELIIDTKMQSDRLRFT